METVLTTVAYFVVIVAYVVYILWCWRRDGRADRDHRDLMTAMSPGPQIRALTSARSNPMRTRKLARGSQVSVPLASSASDFADVPTDYGTYTPAQVAAEILKRTDNRHAGACAESPSRDVGHHAYHHDARSTTNTK